LSWNNVMEVICRRCTSVWLWLSILLRWWHIRLLNDRLWPWSHLILLIRNILSLLRRTLCRHLSLSLCHWLIISHLLWGTRSCWLSSLRSRVLSHLSSLRSSMINLLSLSISVSLGSNLIYNKTWLRSLEHAMKLWL